MSYEAQRCRDESCGDVEVRVLVMPEEMNISTVGTATGIGQKIRCNEKNVSDWKRVSVFVSVFKKF